MAVMVARAPPRNKKNMKRRRPPPPPTPPQPPQSPAEASSQAHLLASEIMAIAGIDAAEKPDGWDYAAYVVEHWLNRGAGPALIRLAVGRVTRWRNRRGKEPPATPNYYHKAVMG